MDAAFFLFLSLVAAAILCYGGSLQPSLAVLRVSGFAAAAVFFWRRRNDPLPVAPYPFLVGGFAALCLGHAFSSVYVWVSLQHALNIALAAVILGWGCVVLASDPEGRARWLMHTLSAIAIVEVAIALFQRFSEGEWRPHGTFDNPNDFSAFLVVLALLFTARALDRSATPPWRSPSAWAGAALIIAGLSLTSSRAVLLCTVPALGVLLVWRYGSRKGIGILLAGLPFLLLLGWFSVDRFLSRDIYRFGRLIIWKSAARTFLEHPLGVGLGGFKYFWYATQSPVADAFRKYAKFATTAHSEYLEILAGLGIAGFALFLAVLFLPLVMAVRRFRDIAEGRRWAAAGALSGLVLCGLHAGFEGNFHEMGIVAVCAALTALLLACLPGAPPPLFTLPRRAGALGAILCLALLATSAATFAGVTFYRWGEGRLKAGDAGGAERAFRAASRIDPLRAVYPDALSSISYNRFLRETGTSHGDPGKAMAHLADAIRWEDRARSLNPREVIYIMRLSALLLDASRMRPEAGDTTLAEALIDEALRIHPYGVEGLWSRANIRAATGRAREAVKDLERAVALEPNFCRGYARLSDLAAAEDGERSAAWAREADACRVRAKGRSLVGFEKWLVESPEGK